MLKMSHGNAFSKHKGEGQVAQRRTAKDKSEEVNAIGEEDCQSQYFLVVDGCWTVTLVMNNDFSLEIH